MSGQGKELAEEEARRYVYNNLSKFHRVQVSQMIHLPCLTEADRQKIRASCTNEGNNETTFLFFQRLCCRQGWVEHFVEALREQHMGDLADQLDNLYRSKLLPPRRTPPPASASPAAKRPSVPPPEWHLTEAQALPSTPRRLAPASANPPPQDMGDYRTPVQENSHPDEKSKLAVHPKATDKGAEPGLSSTSDVSSASNVGRDGAIESPYPVKESAAVSHPVEDRPLPSQTAEPRVEQKWDGRQHHPVTVKNGCFGNAQRPQDSGMGPALPAGASSNQPEEDYYSSDSVSLALGGPREDSAAERKVYVLRGDPKGENPPVVDTPRSRPDSQRKNLPDLDRSSSVGTKAPRPGQEFSTAGGDRSADNFKLLTKDIRSSGEITGTDTLAGRPQWGTETAPTAIGHRKRDTHSIFHSNSTENDMPSKPGVLSSDAAAEDAGETDKIYSGSSERFRMSIKDSVSAGDSDPILLSKTSSGGHSAANNVRDGNRPSVAVDATVPPVFDDGEEETSFRSHHLLVEENRSMDLMGPPSDGAYLRPSLRDFPDSTSDGQPEDKAKDRLACPSVPEEIVAVEENLSSRDFRVLVAGFALAVLASAVYVLYKKK